MPIFMEAQHICVIIAQFDIYGKQIFGNYQRWVITVLSVLPLISEDNEQNSF